MTRGKNPAMWSNARFSSMSSTTCSIGVWNGGEARDGPLRRRSRVALTAEESDIFDLLIIFLDFPIQYSSLKYCIRTQLL